MFLSSRAKHVPRFVAIGSERKFVQNDAYVFGVCDASADESHDVQAFVVEVGQLVHQADTLGASDVAFEQGGFEQAHAVIVERHFPGQLDDAFRGVRAQCRHPVVAGRPAGGSMFRGGGWENMVVSVGLQRR